MIVTNRSFKVSVITNILNNHTVVTTGPFTKIRVFRVAYTDNLIIISVSKIYMIDRLGRYVTGFPVDLKKDILIGPDVYDFNGTKKYNIMVLHKDNTLEMYNLKGEKPASWKGIKPEETIKALPERISVGGNSFWVVRTSIQTLVYPFYGGEPLTVFKGDQMIRPDSDIKILDGMTVEVACYDGKRRTVKIK